MNKMPSLNLAAVCHKTQSLGPGYRAVIWVQGCPFRCDGCISPEWLPIKPARQVAPQALAEELLSDPYITGLTISGGEPVLQASALVEFIRHARSLRELDVILFTGYYYENLLAFPAGSPVQRLLPLLDVLVDGPYVQALNDNRGLRGSSNQRVLHLSSRLQAHDLETAPRQSEIHIADGELLYVGVPPLGVLPGLWQSLVHSLQEALPGGHDEWT